MKREVAISNLGIGVGVGVGIRPPHYPRVLSGPVSVSWFEAISENFLGLERSSGSSAGPPVRMLEKFRENYPVALHGVSLSIGSVDPLGDGYLRRLKALIERIDPVIVSDHLCWTGVAGQNLHDLLPLPWTEESLEHLVGRISFVQEFLGRKMLFENVTRYMSFEQSCIPEWEFLSELSRRTGCGILLDVNNIFVTASHHGFDPKRYLEGVSRESVGQIHLGGYSESQYGLLDTHDHRVAPEVWELYRLAVQKFGSIPTLIEWDDLLPEFSVLEEEAALARRMQREVHESFRHAA